MTSLIPAWLNGQLKPVEKLDVHLRGLRHKAVSVFALRGQQVLLQKRAASKYHTPGLWANTCCTHPHWEESPLDCAVRRLEQELGIVGLTLTHRDEIEYRADVGGGMIEHEDVDVFTALAPAGLQLSLNPDEVSETAWIDLGDLSLDIDKNPAHYTPWLRIYMTEHRERIFGPSSA